VIWLGDRRGYLTDWVTQQWVRATGRLVTLAEQPWLDGPVGGTREIGLRFFEEYAATRDLDVVEDGVCGLLPDFRLLERDNSSLATVSQPVKDFYEQTSAFTLDAWSEWCSAFRPFGQALSVLFSKRLQQLNVPLSSLDSARGMTSSVVPMRDRQSGRIVQTAWVRELRATRNVLYAGCYSVCQIPGHPSPCMKVVFPLPNGNAIVLMKPVAHPDGSLAVQSIGKRFGDPGFYFTVHRGDGTLWARYLGSMKEQIHVYAAEPNVTRADHTLWLWGIQFLRLHYRMARST
jgi:hypothetical protein